MRHTCQVHQVDARVGGKLRMTFRDFLPGHGHSFGGEYLDPVPNELIRDTDQFDDPTSRADAAAAADLAEQVHFAM